MKNKKIEIQGISRMLPSSTSNDGLTRDLLNLRPYNGAIRPVGADTLLQSAGATPTCFIHTMTNGDQYIVAYTTSSGAVTYTKIGTETVGALVTLSASKTIRFASLHNVLVIINDTDQTMAYAVFSTDAGTYNYIGIEKFPETIQVDFAANYNAAYDVSNTAVTVLNEISADNNSIEAALLKIDAENFGKSHITGSVGIIYAWELFDGTIIKHSPPFYMVSGGWWWKHNGGGDANHFTVKSLWNMMSFTIKTSNDDLNTMRASYSNIIKSFNVYMTRPVNTYKPNIATPFPTDLTEVSKETSGVIQSKVLDQQSYYLVKKLTLEEMVYNGEHTLFSGDVDQIATSEPLPVDNFTHHKLYSYSDYLYNSRLWLGKTITTIYDGYNPTSFIKKSANWDHSATAYLVYLEVELKDGTTTKTVVSDQYSCIYYDAASKKDFALETFFAYPDSRASKLTVKTIVSGTHYKAAEYNLTPHPYHNFAYYLFPDTQAINEDSWSAQAIATVSNKIIDNNRIQASKVDNAFVFPAENSYRIGVGAVVGMGANTLNIETGQFGEYPLYAFTSDGIWAMSISRDPSILIDSIKPASMEVCSNSQGILSTPMGVVFVTGRGLFIISGMNAQRIDKPFEGNYLSPLALSGEFSGILADATIGPVSAYNETVSYQTFLNTATIGYNHEKQEVIVANASYPYCYVYSLPSKAWFRIGKIYDKFINYYPKMLGVRTVTSVTSLYDITVEYWTSTYSPVLIETSPIKLELDTLKKITSLALRGLVGTDPTKGLSVNIFATIDGVNWLNLLSREASGLFKDLILSRANYSASQFILVVTGSVTEASYITHADIFYDVKYERKLR